MDRLRLIPLDDTVAFPGMAVSLPGDVGADAQGPLVPRQEETYAKGGGGAEGPGRPPPGGAGFPPCPAPAHRRERMAELEVRKRSKDDVDAGGEKQQREYLLGRQMDAIRKELGESDGSVADEYRKKIADANMPEPVRAHAEREVDRFERMG